MKAKTFRGGINLRLASWKDEIQEKNQCMRLQNLRCRDEFIESIPGTIRFQASSLGSDPITAIMPYYNDQNDQFTLLVASGDSIYKRDPTTQAMTAIKSGLTPNSIFSSTIRYDVMYIATKDNLKKYLGGNQIENVGGGATAPGAFRKVLYMKEIDRIFGVSDDSIFGQITWCDLSQPEIWDGANVERIKLKDGEIVEGADILYGKLVIFCTYSIWIYYVSGNEENWKLEEAPTSVGCVAGETIRKFGNEILFLGEGPRNQLGIYAFNGSTSRLLTDDVWPFFGDANTDRIQNACAEIHDDLYTVTIPYGGSQNNNYSIDLDLRNLKEDGSPAIYGPHPLGFFSSCVLNSRHNSKQWLLGDQSDGFVYREGGTSFKTIDGQGGNLMQHWFLSPTYHEDSWDTIKRYNNLRILFRPRGYFNIRTRLYMSYGVTPIDNLSFNPHATAYGYAGDYNIYEDRFYGSPQAYVYEQRLGAKMRGVSCQLELINDNLDQRIAFDEIQIDSTPLHKVKKAVSYAI